MHTIGFFEGVLWPSWVGLRRQEGGGGVGEGTKRWGWLQQCNGQRDRRWESISQCVGGNNFFTVDADGEEGLQVFSYLLKQRRFDTIKIKIKN